MILTGYPPYTARYECFAQLWLQIACDLHLRWLVEWVHWLQVVGSIPLAIQQESTWSHPAPFLGKLYTVDCGCRCLQDQHSPASATLCSSSHSYFTDHKLNCNQNWSSAMFTWMSIILWFQLQRKFDVGLVRAYWRWISSLKLLRLVVKMLM